MVLFIVLEVDVVVTKYDVLAFVFGYKELETVGIVTATLLVDFTKAVTIELLPRVTEDDNVKLVAEVVAIVELLIIGIMVEIVDVLLLLKLLVADSEVLKWLLNVLYNVLTDFDIGKIEVLLTDIVVARELDISGVITIDVLVTIGATVVMLSKVDDFDTTCGIVKAVLLDKIDGVST